MTFCDYISPTSAELQLREDVLSEIRDIVQDLWPTCKVHVFGSQMTKILTPTSDLDIAVLDVPMTESESVIDILAILAERIVRKDISSYCEGTNNHLHFLIFFIYVLAFMLWIQSYYER